MTDLPIPPEPVVPRSYDVAVDVEASWQRAQARMAQGEQRQVVRARAWWYGRAGVAAAGLIALGIGLSARRPAVAWRDYVTPAGTRESIALPDGTRATLAAGSRLRVPVRYANGDRQVLLDGEAYFAVMHDDRHPFAVLANNITITDVGTEFDVRAYDDDIHVAVARGSVLVGAGRGNGAIGYARHSMNAGTVSRTRPPAPPNDPTFFQYIPSSPRNTPSSFQDIPLSAGDAIDVTNGVPTITRHADIAMATAWLQGRLVFKNTPLKMVASELSRAFGLRITVADTGLASRVVTGSFSEDERPDDVLSAVAISVDATFERTGVSVVLERGRLPVPERPAPAVEMRTARAGAQ